MYKTFKSFVHKANVDLNDVIEKELESLSMVVEFNGYTVVSFSFLEVGDHINIYMLGKFKLI